MSFSLSFHFLDDNTQRSVGLRSLELFLLLNANVNDKVIIIADTQHTERWSESEVDPTLCEGDLAFLCNCSATLENLRLWAHERTFGIPRNGRYGEQSSLQTLLVRLLKINT